MSSIVVFCHALHLKENDILTLSALFCDGDSLEEIEREFN